MTWGLNAGGATDSSQLSEKDLDGAFRPHLAVPEIWAVRPVVLESVRGLSGLRPHRHLAKRLSPLMPPTSGLPDHWVFDRGTAFFWTTANQRRAFGPRLESAGIRVESQRRFPFVSGSGPWAVGLAGEVVGTLAWDHEPLRHALVHLLHVARGRTAFYERLLTRVRPDVVVVASQYSLQARCVLLAARRLEIASVLVPHAPYATNRYHQDLPVGRALLRGEGEAEAYMRLGARADRVRVIGAPGIDDRFDRCPKLRHPPVVAPSPWPQPRLARFMRVVEASLEAPFVVCPHPRSDRAQLRRMLPTRASLSRRATADVLVEGPRVVVQSSSGVALEALLLGLPVIDVAGDSDPAYPVIRSPFVTSVSTVSELREAVCAADRVHLAGARQRWARRWCGSVGTQAAENLDRGLVDVPVNGVALDAWAQECQ